MTLTDAARRVPFREGVFDLPGNPAESPRLHGVACPQCGDRFAGKRAICLSCGCRELAPCLLAATGHIATFTIVHQRPPGGVLEPPYAIVQVALDDGPHVTSVLAGEGKEAARVGLPVRMTLVEVRRDDAGNSVVAHAFTPCEAAP